MDIPDAEDTSSRKADDVLVFVVANDLRNCEEMAHQLARGAGPNMRMPYTDHFVDTTGHHHVCAGTVIKSIHAFWDNGRFNFTARGLLRSRI